MVADVVVLVRMAMVVVAQSRNNGSGSGGGTENGSRSGSEYMVCEVAVEIAVLGIMGVVTEIIKLMKGHGKGSRPYWAANARPESAQVPPQELCLTACRAPEVCSGIGRPDRDRQALQHLPLHSCCLPSLPHGRGFCQLFPD